MARSPDTAPPDFLDYALVGCGAKRDEATADAFQRAGALISGGRTVEALAMLEYAQRLAPADGGISLAIGMLQLNLGEARAAESFASLTKRSQWRDLWMALARAEIKFGQVERAAIALHTALSRNAPPTKPDYVALANTVTERSDAQGWCGLNNDGRVIVGSTRNLAIGLAVLLDGIKIADCGLRLVQGRNEVPLPEGWQRASRLDVLLRGHALIGSPIDIAQVARVEGFVEAIPATGELRGWCWFPAERERPPLVTVAALANPRLSISFRAELIDPSLIRGDEFGFPYRFAVAADTVATFGEAVIVTGPRGQALYGSPLWPDAVRGNARAVAAVSPRCPRAAALAQPVSPCPVDIVIPVYTGFETTLACIAAVRAGLGPGERIIVVADASPDAQLVVALAALADRGDIVLRIETVNRGFPGAANIGLRLAAGHDAVLLNSDTIVTPGWLAALHAAVHGTPDIGTATPLSNDATIFSYPRRDIANRFPQDPTALAALAAAVNKGEAIDVPTGHGFCLYIRAECLTETGLLREDLFAQGCGEENDFCMRARHLGWRHVAVPGAYVAHHGAQSFNAARDDLMRRNLATLNQLHVGYDAMIAAWQARDPLADSRRRMDLARLRRDRAGHQGVLLITHDRAGGVRRYVEQRAGREALVLRPDNAKDANGRITSHAVLLDRGFEDAYPNLRFRLPEEGPALSACLDACAISGIEVNSLVGHHDSLVDLVLGRTVPFDVVIHDYAWFCPRITLTAAAHRYCGEPAIAECRDCVAANGTNLDEDVSPDALLARSRRLFGAARAIVAPSKDAARRIRTRFGVAVTVRPWQAPRAYDLPVVAAATARTRTTRVCVVGAIGPEKGYDTLLACARAAAAGGLKLEFVVVGHTSDDRRLLDTGVVRITGRYTEAEAVSLIGAQNADFAWLPAVWPETWSYVLTLIWDAGLHVVVHDIGAQAERVRADGGGTVVPLNVPPERLVALFLGFALFRDRGPAPRQEASRQFRRLG
jgi:GT2 family glycosyltransferase/glycosyltransferase involved in cell wall biosynthesis